MLFSDVVEEEKTIMRELEGVVCQAIAHVLKNRIMDYYEEVLSLLYSVTCSQISAPVWEALKLIHEVCKFKINLSIIGPLQTNQIFAFELARIYDLNTLLLHETINFCAKAVFAPAIHGERNGIRSICLRLNLYTPRIRLVVSKLNHHVSIILLKICFCELRRWE